MRDMWASLVCTGRERRYLPFVVEDLKESIDSQLSLSIFEILAK